MITIYNPKTKTKDTAIHLQRFVLTVNRLTILGDNLVIYELFKTIVMVNKCNVIGCKSRIEENDSTKHVKLHRYLLETYYVVRNTF